MAHFYRREEMTELDDVRKAMELENSLAGMSEEQLIVELEAKAKGSCIDGRFSIHAVRCELECRRRMPTYRKVN